MKQSYTLLGLDVGSVRVGVSRANSIARIAEPLTTLLQSKTIYEDIKQLVSEHNAQMIVVGLPQNVLAEDTAQTRYVRDFIKRLPVQPHIKVVFQDEATSSIRAEKLLSSRKKPFSKSDVDAEAATLILQDYMDEQGQQV